MRPLQLGVVGVLALVGVALPAGSSATKAATSGSRSTRVARCLAVRRA
jgi:hypothetical protein